MPSLTSAGVLGMQRIIVDVSASPSIAASDLASIPAMMDSTVVDSDSLPCSAARTDDAI